MDREATIIDMGNNTFFVSIIHSVGIIQFVDESTGKTVVIPNVLRSEIEAYENGTSVDDAFPAMTSLNKKALEIRMNGIDNITLN
tara:strand:- start:126 stop:380 length:255 start_codon:yes stop_codon:yes gene_type:complete